MLLIDARDILENAQYYRSLYNIFVIIYVLITIIGIVLLFYYLYRKERSNTFFVNKKDLEKARMHYPKARFIPVDDIEQLKK